MTDARTFGRIQQVRASIESARVQIATEDSAQRAIFEALIADGIPAQREVKLDGRSRLDLLAFDDIAIEVKTQGARRAVWKQVERYAGYLFVNQGSDPVLMEMLGLKASQSEGILNPYSEAVAQRIQDTRVRQLAKSVLGIEEGKEDVA